MQETRETISNACKAAGDPLRCGTVVSVKWPCATKIQMGMKPIDNERETLYEAMKLKRRSTFCLEPPGFSPTRKASALRSNAELP